MMMYEEIAKANARNKVAFDVLTYHASSTMDEVNRLMVGKIGFNDELWRHPY